MIRAIKHARIKKIPFLGICLGFQLAVIEFARHVCQMGGATSGEFLSEDAAKELNADKKREEVIMFMPEISRTHMGGTMRLGLRPTVFEKTTESKSAARKVYGGAAKIWERHRHRYEVNPAYVNRLAEAGLDFVGKDEKGERMQVLELDGASPPPLHFLSLASLPMVE